VALNDGQLQPYRYDAGQQSWVQMNPTTPVTLNDPDVWGQPEHYWTFRAGDVDGDGRDEIIARGAYGIRTWFHDRRGTGGWERYLPPDYPGFTGGQADAFAKLTELAKAGNYIPQDASSVRSVWTLENPPTANDLSNINHAVISIAQCSGSQSPAPPRYEKCTLPAGATFSVADWTAVVNEVFAEIYAAQQVLSHFSNLDSMRTSLFIGENAELPAIGSELGLQVAANTKATFNQQDYWEEAMQIIGSIAGIANPAAGAAMSIAGDIVSMVPSAAPSLMSAYQTTYAGVETQFANAVGAADKAAAALSQTVRQDYSLLNLVAQLREQGTWQPDLIGVESAANQAFAGWVYQSLLPAVYDRYEVTYCLANPNNGPACVPPSKSASYPGVIGQANGPTFTALSAPPQKDWTGHESVPCSQGFANGTCSYPTLPQPLANLVFGPVSPGCDYQPGNANTAWTFGCNLGLSAQTTVGAAGPLNGWNFTSWTADPVCVCGIPLRAKRTHAVGRDASVRITDVVRVPRGFRFARARAVPTRVLFEPLGRKELAGPAPFVSRPADRPRGARKPRRPRTRVRLRRLGPTKLWVDIRTRRKGLRVPQACQELPYSLQPRNTVVRLETRLRLSDGRRRRTQVIRRSWRCERDRTGKIMRLRLVNERRARVLRHGLRSRIVLPRSIRPGARTIARLRVINARRRGALRHVVVTGSYVARGRGASGMVAKRIAPLGAGRSRTVRLRLRVPRTARGRLCVRTTAIAALAHDSTRRACKAIRQPTKAHRALGTRIERVARESAPNPDGTVWSQV
jgi:hypothetical protein